MTGLLQWFRDRRARKAARFLNSCRVRRERAEIRAKARQLREECGLPPSAALQ